MRAFALFSDRGVAGRVLTRTDGAAAIEFALVAPLLAFMVAGAVNVGLAIRTAFLVNAAVASGGQYAMVNGWNSTQITAAVTSGTGDAGVSASPAPSVAYGCPSGTAITAATSTTVCADGITARRYVTVSASMARPSVFPTSFGLPTTITATQVVQIP